MFKPGDKVRVRNNKNLPREFLGEYGEHHLGGCVGEYVDRWTEDAEFSRVEIFGNLEIIVTERLEPFVAKVKGRLWADRKDKSIPEADYKKHGIQDRGATGHDPSPDAIGRFFGMQWYEYFICRKTGDLYKVLCYDGANRSKGAYDEEAEERDRRKKEAAQPVNELAKSPSKFSGVMAHLLVKWAQRNDSEVTK